MKYVLFIWLKQEIHIVAVYKHMQDNDTVSNEYKAEIEDALSFWSQVVDFVHEQGIKSFHANYNPA